ncbi:MAG: ribosome silencing factor [Candidatus Angelobacter sp.]
MSLQTRQQVAQAVRAIEGKKGEDVVILEMDKNSGAFTDYFVVCSGTNPRQIQAIADDVQKQMAEIGRRPNSVEGYTQAEWVLLDYVDFVLHIFSERARKFYDLERLWKSARKLTPSDLAKKPAAKKPAAARKEIAKKAPARKKAAAPSRAARSKTRTQTSRTQSSRTQSKKKTRKSA